MLLAQLNEVGQALVLGAKIAGGNREQLSPMRTHAKWAQFFFNQRQQLPYGRPLLLPGEMDCNARAFIAGAQPELIGGNGTNLRNQQVWCNLGMQAPNGENRVDRVLTSNKVLRLKLLSRARNKAHTIVR